MKRTLMLKNQELLDFEVDTATGNIRILDAPDADDELLSSLGFGGPDMAAFVADIIRNLGIIRNLETGACRPAPPFDYDRAFGFPFEEFPFESLCSKPEVAAFLCACSFSDLDSSWDWSWYDPQALEGFEGRIVEEHAHCAGFQSNLGELVARLFAMQRDYANEVVLKWQQEHR